MFLHMPQSSILIIDDDPAHLHIYCLVVESAGFRALPVQVSCKEIELPQDAAIDAVLLDYCLPENIRAADIARRVRAQYPDVPIMSLSDLPEAPADIAPLVQGFVRKGNPEKLIATLRKLVQKSPSLPQATV
jgi:DNA-binding response OmpR family regulator